MMEKYEIVRQMAFNLNTSEMPDEPVENMLDRIIDGNNASGEYRQGFVDGLLFIKCAIFGKFGQETGDIDQIGGQNT